MSTTGDRQKATCGEQSGREEPPLVRQYIDLGWHCLPLVLLGKKAFHNEWSQLPFDEQELRRSLKNGCNVGVRLDGNLVDLDFDRPEARRLSGYFFGECPAFRRASLPADAPGHRIVYCSNPTGKAIKFQFSGKKIEGEARAFFHDGPGPDTIYHKPKLCLMEIRNGSGAQTGFPPSVYDNGRGGRDQLVWNETFNPDAIPTMTYEEIGERAAWLSFSVLALRGYPIAAGSRDEYCLKLAGAIVALGGQADFGDDLIVHLATLAGDEEAEARRGKVARTIERREANEEVSGLPAFLDFIGFGAAADHVRKWFGQKKAKSKKPVVMADQGAIPTEMENYDRNSEFVRQLKAKNADIFIRVGELVRVRVWDQPGTAEVEVGTASVTVNVAYADIERLQWRVLRTYASKLGIRFSKLSRDGAPVAEPDPKQDFYEDLIKSPAEWDFAHLKGLSLVPTLSRHEPGYDPTTGLYLTFRRDKFQAVPERPTKADAEAALARLLHPVRAYEWEDDRLDKSVFAAAVISAVIRASYPGLYPMFTFDATKPGSGKTKLMLICGMFANGGAVPSLETWNPSPQEFDKKLFANLLAGTPCILYDNVAHKIASQELESLLTAGPAGYRSRILGVSEQRRVPADVFVAASGNRLQFGTDMTRRVLRCGLNPTAERPEERDFDFDPVEEYLHDFPTLVVDALTILKAFLVSGDRVTVLPSDMKGFRLVQQALVWLGMADPLESKAGVRERDVDGRVKGTTLEWLQDRFGSDTFRAWQVARHFDDLKAAGLVPQTFERSRQTVAALCGTLLSDLIDFTWGEMRLVAEKQGGDKAYRIEGASERVERFPDTTGEPPF